MYQPRVRRIFVQEAMKQRIPNSLLSFFVLYQIVFGFKFGCTKVMNMKFKMVAHWFSIVMGCLMMSALTLTFTAMPDAGGSGHYWRHISFAQYIPTFCILISMKYTVCEFLSDLIVAPDSNRIGLVAWVYTLLMFSLKISGAMLYCALTTCTERSEMFLQFFIHVPMLALDVIPVVNSLIFYHIYTRVRNLKIKLSQREISLVQLDIEYKAVADCFDKFRGGYDAMFIWGFLTDSPKFMLVMWNHLHSMRTFKSWLMKSSTYVYAMHATLQICIPAVFAEMITAQTDEIKMILHEWLLTEKDTSSSARSLRYVEARPLLRKAWRLLPLDLRLPTTMLSMCATYLIVIIQFTHLYD
ncbi:uncharacterized protein LOC133530473 isoform X2 [Cydia pomonella]|uniref:uncharacterized protein LOC133530473 isoform X2 n=1 Tax=Cydia pomonella TaxID=82600 RepID=UPI002ADDE5E7|nr:uncharacterized protein LOC133530473 isoform X2 [Cydia pomonella]